MKKSTFLVSFLFCFSAGIWAAGAVESARSLLSVEANEVLYSESFDTESSLDGFTILDGNNDGRTWSYYSSKKMVQYWGGDEADEWLFMPEMNLEAGTNYKLRFKTGLENAVSEKQLCQAIRPLDRVISRKGLIKVHELMEGNRLICLVFDQNPPVSPMPVSIPDEIVDYIHHIVSIFVQREDKLLPVSFMVCQPFRKGLHRRNGILPGSKIFARAHQLSIKRVRLIKQLLHLKAAAYPAGQ